jgi:hypothetical protein
MRPTKESACGGWAGSVSGFILQSEAEEKPNSSKRTSQN